MVDTESAQGFTILTGELRSGIVFPPEGKITTDAWGDSGGLLDGFLKIRGIGEVHHLYLFGRKTFVTWMT